MAPSPVQRSLTLVPKTQKEAPRPIRLSHVAEAKVTHEQVTKDEPSIQVRKEAADRNTGHQ